MNYKKTQKMNNIVRIGQLSSEKSQAGTVYHEGGGGTDHYRRNARIRNRIHRHGNMR